LAGELDAEIFLARVVVVIDAFSGLRFDPDILRMIDDAKRYLAELESRFEMPMDRTVPIVPYGDNAAKELITIAEKEGIDLIMMASHCKDGLQRLTQGSVYWDVVRSRLCPVCACPCPELGPAADVPRWQREDLPCRILIAVDGSAECEVSVRSAARWVGVLNADFYLLQVVDRSASTRGHVPQEPERERVIEAGVPVMIEKARTYLNELASRFELPLDRTVPLVRCGEDAAREITTIAEDEHIDLIVMSSHCRSWPGQLALGSVHSEVVRSRVCPVLCVPLPRAEIRGRRWGVLARRR
jgi:nucleotide-binding universal stress UspA family protein